MPVFDSESFTLAPFCSPNAVEGQKCFLSFFEHSADAMSLFNPKTLRLVDVNEATVRLVMHGYGRARHPSARLFAQAQR